MPRDGRTEQGPSPERADNRQGAPSHAARERLSDALHDRAEAYRQDAAVDLTLMEVLLRSDEPEAAARTLAHHRASLLAMADDLQAVVAGAAVEREAELVCEASLAPPAPAPTRFERLRHRALALTGAAAVAVALFVPAARVSPRTMLTSLGETNIEPASAARERLVAARSWARALRADAAGALTVPAQGSHSRSAPRDATVRSKVRAVLDGGTSRGTGNAGGSTRAGGVLPGAGAAERDPGTAPARTPDEGDGPSLRERIEKRLPESGKPLTTRLPVRPEQAIRDLHSSSLSADDLPEQPSGG